MHTKIDFIILGAGIVGLSTALALAKKGYQVMLLDAGEFQDKPGPSRVYAINLASQQLFEQLEIWEKLQPFAAPYDRMHVWDGLTQAEMHFDSRSIARNQLGVILEESAIKTVLFQKVSEWAIPIIYGWQMQSMEEHAECMMLHSPTQSFQASYVIIAEGAHSSSRTLLKVPMISWPYHQHALVAKVHIEKPHQRTAHQIFCEQGPLAFLPLRDPHECSIVWSSGTQHIESLMALSDADFVKELTLAFQEHLGQTTVLSPRQCFPLRMQHVRQYVGHRWLLMGDAAHTLHPLAGLGLNIGLADLTTFLGLLKHHPNRFLTRQALKAYQRQRKHALWQMIAFLQGVHYAFTNHQLPIKMVRSLGLTVFQRTPLLKRLCIEQASGVN